MEDRQQLAVDGEEVALEDLNAAWKVASLQDDRVLAELYRLTPFGSAAAKAIVPYGITGQTYDGSCTVEPSGSADGKVRVKPFRAIVGSRSTIATFISGGETSVQAAKDNWRDIRSGVFADSSDGTTLAFAQSLGANSSGNPRWDLVYAQLSVEANGASDTRFVRPPSGGAPAPAAELLTLSCPVTIVVQPGTPAVSPTFPSAPADAGGNYNFPLAYVRVPNGFTSGSTVASGDIYDVAAAAHLSRVTGMPSLAPASGMYKQGGASQTNYPWAATAGARPAPYLPPEMLGGEIRFFGLNYGGSDTIANGGILDDSIDWRYRAFMVFVQAITRTGGAQFAWEQSATVSTLVPGTGASGRPLSTAWMMGQSFEADGYILSGMAAVCSFMQVAADFAVALSSMAASPAQVGLYVDMSTGALKVFTAGSPNVKVMYWLFATAPFPNY